MTIFCVQNNHDIIFRNLDDTSADDTEFDGIEINDTEFDKDTEFDNTVTEINDTEFHGDGRYVFVLISIWNYWDFCMLPMVTIVIVLGTFPEHDLHVLGSLQAITCWFVVITATALPTYSFSLHCSTVICINIIFSVSFKVDWKTLVTLFFFLQDHGSPLQNACLRFLS